MSEFFHGWRPKVGCVTLVIACVFMGFWIKSRFVADTLSATAGGHTCHVCFLNKGIVLIHLDEAGMRGDRSARPSFEWQSERYPDQPSRGEIPSPIDALADRAVWGFRYYGESSEYESYRIVIVPFWCVVCPFTLLSASLLLWKRRKKAAQPTSHDAYLN